MPNPHPIIVHFPIALFVAAVICDFAAYFSGSRGVGLAATINAVAAALSSMAAVATGLLAEELVPKIGDARTVLESHEALGFVVLGTSIIFATLKLYEHIRKSDKFLIFRIAVGLVGVIVTILAAHEGGELVYRYRVGVAADSIQTTSKYYPMTSGTDPFFKPKSDSTTIK